MKFFISLSLTALLALAIGFYLGWWSIAIAAFIVAVIVHQGPGKAWLAGFLAIFLLWGILAWWIDKENESILSKRMAELLPVNNSTVLLILLTALAGALVGGFAALTGSFMRKRK